MIPSINALKYAIGCLAMTEVQKEYQAKLCRVIHDAKAEKQCLEEGHDLYQVRKMLEEQLALRTPKKKTK